MGTTIDSPDAAHNELHLLLQKLATDIVLDRSKDCDIEKIKEYVETLKTIYVDGFRHYYARIANLIYKELNTEQREALSENLKTIQETYAGFYPSDFDLKQGFEKLFDHVDLEIARISYITAESEAMHGNIENVKREMYTARDSATAAWQELNKKIEQTEEKVNGIHAQSITILSIFSAVVFAFSGGFTLLGSSIQSAASAPRSNIFFVYAAVGITGIVLMNIVYCMFAFGLKLSGKKMSLGCQRDACADCKECRSLLGKLYKRHPLAVLLNALIPAVLVVVLLVFSSSFVNIAV